MIIIKSILVITAFLINNDVDAVLYGDIAQPGQFRYQVLLQIMGARARTCGGAIIHEKVILTAWHCVDNTKHDDIYVIVGAVLYNGDKNAALHRVKNVVLHESRSCQADERRCYDIAVVTLTKKIRQNDYASAIPLPTEDIEIGDSCSFAGWGANEERPNHPSNELRFGYSTIWPHSTCKRSVDSIKDYEFCLWHPNQRRTTIDSGDSGGPIVCNGVLSGVAIRGSGDDLGIILAVNVYQLRDFIDDNIDQETCCCYGWNLMCLISRCSP